MPGTPEVAAYCTRLNKLVSAVLVNAGPVAGCGRTSRPTRARCAADAPQNAAADGCGWASAAASYFGSNFSDTPFMQ